MTIKSGTGQACAACKYQRRRCTPECLLAPFFPADQPKMFLNVHRLFGVKNIQNLLKDLGPDPTQKAIAMKSIKFHATMRDKYPVWGCMAEIRHLSSQIHLAEEELHLVLQHLAYYRHHHQQQQQHLSPSSADHYVSELHLGMAPPGNPDYSSINYLDFKEMNNVVNSMCQQQQQQQSCSNNSNENNPNSVVTHAHLSIPEPPLSLPQDYNEMEMQPFFDTIDDTQSYIGSKETYDHSSLSLESSLKDSRQLVEEIDENELKSAAACFSLTSVN